MSNQNRHNQGTINIEPLNIRRSSTSSVSTFNNPSKFGSHHATRTSSFSFGSSMPSEHQFGSGQSPVSPAFGMFRRFSQSGTSHISPTSSFHHAHSFDSSSPTLTTHEEMPASNLDNYSPKPLKAVSALQAESKKDAPSRPETPMKQMILQGQFLD